MRATRHLLLWSAIAITSAACGSSNSTSGPVDAPPSEVAEIAFTPPGTPVGPASATMVPVTGGVVTSADQRLAIEVPAGALTAAQNITIQPISNGSPGGKGLAYRLGPEGQTFSSPVKVTFRYDDSDIAGSEPLALKIAYQDKLGRWNAITEVVRDEAAKTITVQAKHFSDWSLLGGWQLRPPTSVVSLGKAVDLTVMGCASKGSGDDELASLMYTCVPETENFTVKLWNVNGVEHGSLALGRLTPTGEGTARYVAPNTAPAPKENPVSVEASTVEKGGRKLLLVAHVSVGSNPPFSGTITSTQVNQGNDKDVQTTLANVVFKYDVELERYRVSEGTLVSHIDIFASGCEQHLAYSGAIGADDGTILLDGEGGYFAQGSTANDFSGTTNCNGDHTTTPLMVYGGALWWPAPLTNELKVKPDGRLEDTVTNVFTSGRIISAHWELSPLK